LRGRRAHGAGEGAEGLEELVGFATAHAAKLVDEERERNRTDPSLDEIVDGSIVIPRPIYYLLMARAAGIAPTPDVPAPLERAATGTFRALRRYNYRTWAFGAAIS